MARGIEEKLPSLESTPTVMEAPMGRMVRCVFEPAARACTGIEAAELMVSIEDCRVSCRDCLPCVWVLNSETAAAIANNDRANDKGMVDEYHKVKWMILPLTRSMMPTRAKKIYSTLAWMIFG